MTEKKEPTAAEVVADINTDVYAALFGDREPHGADHDLFALATLTYSTDGSYEGVEFLGQNLWDDQDNGIPWDDAKDEPSHSLKDHLLLKMAQTIRALSAVANACDKAALSGPARRS